MAALRHQPRPSGEGARRPVSPWWWVVGTTALAAVVVVLRIGRRSLWFDEGASIGTVDRPLGDALWRIAHWELNQAPFYLLLWPWARLTSSDAGLRLLPAALAVACIPVLYAVGRRLLGPRWALVACLFLSVHALLAAWAQQLRGYTLAVLVVTATALLLLRTVERPTWARCAALGVVAGLSVYGHFFGGLVVATQLATLLVLRPVPWRVLLAGGGVAAAVSLPAVVFAATAEGDPLSWTGAPRRSDLVGTLQSLGGAGAVGGVLVGALVVVGAAVLLWSCRGRWGTTEAWRAVLPVAWLVVPVVAATVLSATVQPLLVDRYLIVVVPAVVLLAAAGVARAPWRGLAVAVVVAVVGLSGIALLEMYRSGSYEDWRRAAAMVDAEAAPGEVVVVVPDRAAHVTRHYGIDGPGAPPLLEHDEVVGADPPGVWLLERTTPAAYRPSDAGVLDVLGERFVAVHDEDVGGVRVVHLVPVG